MGVNKNFVVKNGLEVNTSLIVADTNTNSVGIGTSVSLYTLHVNGGIGATNIYISGVGTIPNISGTTLTYTNGSITNLVGTIGTIATLNSTNGTVTNISGTIGTITSLSGTNVTATNLVGTSGTITNLSGTIGTVTTLNSTSGTITNLSGTIGTIGNVRISSGIVTAASGIVTYYGDGQYLNLANNPTNGIGIATAGGLVGSGATILDFRGAGISTVTVSSGIGTLFIQGGGGGGGSVSISSIAPASPTGGDLWYSINYGRTFVYYDEVALGIGSTAVWVDAAPFNTTEPDPVPAKASTTFTATLGQTNFNVIYKPGYVDVYLNGVRLSGSEFVANNGTSVILVDPAALGDVIDVVEYTMGIGSTGPQGAGGPLQNITLSTDSNTYYPIFAVGVGTTTPYINTFSNYFSFVPSSGTLSLNQLNVAGVATATGGFNIGISSAGSVITSGPVKTLNFVGTGNTFAVNGTTVDISISGGGGGSGISGRTYFMVNSN